MPLMRWLAVLALASACHGGKGASTPAPKTTPYLMLFETGRSWTLPSGNASVTCKVAEIKPVGDATVARLDCGALLVSGTWVSTPAGLYHPSLPVDDPDELTLLGEDDLLITRVPVEREHSHALEGGAQDAIEAFAFETSWCVRQTTQSSTDRRSFTLCFDGKDITGGAEETASGAQTSRAAFGKAPPDAAVPEQEESRD